jgi:hypothetical protein
MPPSLPACDPEKVYMFTIALTVYSLLKKKASTKGKASTSKEEKSVKVKELHFSTNNANYLDFLRSILDKHRQEQYKVLEKRRFPFKYVPPKAKRSVVYCFIALVY